MLAGIEVINFEILFSLVEIIRSSESPITKLELINHRPQTTQIYR